MKHFMLCAVQVMLVAVSLCFGLNASVIYMGQPVNVQHQEVMDHIDSYDGVSIDMVDNLQSGGFGTLSLGISGYVNVFSPEMVMYVDSGVEDMTLDQRSYLADHEYAHVLEKKMIAAQVGGYPSVSNPWRSFAYYSKLLELNSFYSSIMPSAQDNGSSFTVVGGLESAADCFAQDPGGHSPMLYIGSDVCSAEQRAVALALRNGSWPVK